LKEMEPGTISEFCRSAIIEKVHREFSEDYANQQYKYHMEQAQRWKQKKTSLQEDTEKVNKILEEAIDYYNDMSQDPHISELTIRKYIKFNVLDKLQSARCNRFNVNDIIKICKEGRINISK